MRAVSDAGASFSRPEEAQRRRMASANAVRQGAPAGHDADAAAPAYAHAAAWSRAHAAAAAKAERLAGNRQRRRDDADADSPLFRNDTHGDALSCRFTSVPAETIGKRMNARRLDGCSRRRGKARAERCDKRLLSGRYEARGNKRPKIRSRPG